MTTVLTVEKVLNPQAVTSLQTNVYSASVDNGHGFVWHFLFTPEQLIATLAPDAQLYKFVEHDDRVWSPFLHQFAMLSGSRGVKETLIWNGASVVTIEQLCNDMRQIATLPQILPILLHTLLSSPISYPSDWFRMIPFLSRRWQIA